MAQLAFGPMAGSLRGLPPEVRGAFAGLRIAICSKPRGVRVDRPWVLGRRSGPARLWADGRFSGRANFVLVPRWIMMDFRSI